jgi:hypothetical protein
MTTQQYERRIEELKQVGLDLHERCEQWRKALEEIARFNTDPIIGSIIQRSLNT